MKRQKGLFFLILVLIGCQISLLSQAGEPFALFKAGDAGYACFRIPAIIQSGNGTLLAFAEARKKGCSDTGDIDIVLRRSSDNGKTWGTLQMVWDAGDDVAGNPAPVFDAATGTIWLLTTWNLGSDEESQIIAQTSRDTRRIFVLRSDDQGATWSKPNDITADVKLPAWTWYATGPVHGIQLQNGSHKGRMMIPCDHIEAGTKKYYSHVIWSDDHGKSWQLGGSTPQDQVNECTVAELPDGRLMLNMRNYDRKMKNRQVSISGDGGKTWSDLYSDPQLIEPICQAGLLSITRKKGKSDLFFLNPADSLSRINLVLKMSRDEGRSWQPVEVINAGPSAYSDLVRISHKEIGCLYEAGMENPYEAIWFKKADHP